MKKTFTILHTNDMHSAFIGMGPASDYTPFTLNDDTTRGGYARLATLIAKRKEAGENQGPVLVLDAGDFSMGTAFAAASREIGGELQIMSLMGYDATTFGNHEFDLGPDGLAKAIGVAAKAGRIPAVLPSNAKFTGDDATLVGLQDLARDGVIRRYLVIERGGIRFGLFGVLGKEAQFYASPGAASFSDAIETAVEMVKVLRETEKVDVVIALSHGGVEKDKQGKYTDGDDVRLAKSAPGIDVVIGGHSHTRLDEAIIVNDHDPHEKTTLAVECGVRHPVLAITIAAANFSPQKAMPVLVPCILTFICNRDGLHVVARKEPGSRRTGYQCGLVAHQESAMFKSTTEKQLQNRSREEWMTGLYSVSGSRTQ